MSAAIQALPVAAQPCLIVNPLSFRASRRGLASQAIALAGLHGAEVIQVSEPAQIGIAMDSLRKRRQARIFVLAGDGTVQAIAQYLAQLPPGEWLPDLLLLGGGRTNTIARSFAEGPPLHWLEAALKSTRDGASLTVREVPLLRLEQEGSPPHHGFLLVAAMIDSGVRLCRQHRMAGTSWLHKGPLADSYRLVKLGAQVMVGHSPLPPYSQLQITTDTGETLAGPQRILLGTTLLRPHGLYNPFAARGAGPLRITAVRADASRFWRRLPRLITGHFTDDMNVKDGYLSGGFQQAEVVGLRGYSLDGEAFEADPAHPVVIRVGMSLRVLQP